MKQMRKLPLMIAAGCLAGLLAVPGRAEAADKHKIFLSMSYIGNDWQAEAANMVKAMAASADMQDKIALEVQVAGPDAQRQIQQINSMVQAGAEAIVVYPISPTALNQVVRAACRKGVMIIAYDAQITEPCAYNVSIDQEEAGAGHCAVARGQDARQGHHRRHHRRAWDLGGYAAHQGREGGLRPATRYQDHRRGTGHVEPGRRAHRAV